MSKKTSKNGMNNINESNNNSFGKNKNIKDKEKIKTNNVTQGKAGYQNKNNQIQMLILTGLFTALTAVGGFIKIPLPVISFTLQLPVVILSGLVLGAKYGAVSQILYLVLGLLGLPIFTKGGGLHYLLEPSFGYIIGFIFVSWFFGAKLSNKNINKGIYVIFYCLIGILIDYGIGATYMYFVLKFYLNQNISIVYVLWSGIIIFIPKDIILSLLTYVSYKRIKKVVFTNKI